ncbi:MAG: hypothetical protein EP329_27765 [Deltaproteobacteria bacterium]|nr:MAG: hypothetical protein EP329_27765 [Deltaproteobacteria bacterium]
MTQPIERHPGRFYWVTRRCERREFRLTPDEATNNAIGVLLHDACEATGVVCLAWCFMSNHYHAVVWDREGRLSEWESHLNGVLAQFLNVSQGRVSHVWDSDTQGVEELDDLDLVIQKVVYTLANPVSAGLVASPSAWPGVMTSLEELGTGTGRAYRRPSVYFSRRGRVSEDVVLASHAPPGMEPEEFRRRVKRGLEARVEAVRAAMKAAGRRFLGAAAVLAQLPSDAPKTAPSPRNRGGRGMSWASSSYPERRKELQERRRQFRRRYRACFELLQAGVALVTFPLGTFKLWRFSGVHRELSREAFEALPPPALHPPMVEVGVEVGPSETWESAMLSACAGV